MTTQQLQQEQQALLKRNRSLRIQLAASIIAALCIFITTIYAVIKSGLLK